MSASPPAARLTPPLPSSLSTSLSFLSFRFFFLGFGFVLPSPPSSPSDLAVELEPDRSRSPFDDFLELLPLLLLPSAFLPESANNGRWVRMDREWASSYQQRYMHELQTASIKR